MANSIPTFTVFRHRRFVGLVSAWTEQQAHIRAEGLYGRCEVMMISATRKLQPRGRVRRSDSSYTQGRSPYPVGDFEGRRAAELARWQSGE